MTLLSGAVPIGPADDTGSGVGFQNLTEADRAAIWEGMGGRQGIRRGLVHATVPGSMALTFTPGTAVAEERDALGAVGTDRGYIVYQRPTDGDVTVTFDVADASDRNDAVVVAAVDVEDAAFGAGVSAVGGQIVVVRGVSGVTTPRTDADINAWLGAGAGGWFRYLDVAIPSGSTQIAGGNISLNLDSTADLAYARLVQSGTQNVANNNLESMAVNTVDRQNRAGFGSTANKLTIPHTGYFDIRCRMTWDSTVNTGTRYLELRIDAGVAAVDAHQAFAGSGTRDMSHVFYSNYFSGGEVVDAQVFQDSGATISADTAIPAYLEVRQRRD